MVLAGAAACASSRPALAALPSCRFSSQIDELDPYLQVTAPASAKCVKFEAAQVDFALAVPDELVQIPRSGLSKSSYRFVAGNFRTGTTLTVEESELQALLPGGSR